MCGPEPKKWLPYDSLKTDHQRIMDEVGGQMSLPDEYWDTRSYAYSAAMEMAYEDEASEAGDQQLRDAARARRLFNERELSIAAAKLVKWAAERKIRLPAALIEWSAANPAPAVL